MRRRPVSSLALLGLAWSLSAGTMAQDAGVGPHPELCPLDHIGCHTDDMDWLHRDALFADVDFDTGWVPASSPLQLRFMFNLAGSTEIAMGGTSVTSWPPPLAESVPGRPDTGDFSVNYGYEVHVLVRFDVTVAGIRYAWMSEIPIPFIPADLRVADEAHFDPYILPPTDPRPIEVHDTTERIHLFSVGLGSIIGITGIDGGLAVDGQAALDGFWQTDRLVVSDARPILDELGSTVMGPGAGVLGFGAFKDVFVHPEGTLHYTGTLNFYPNLFISVVGVDFHFDLAEIPVTLVDLDSNVIFDDAMSHVPLPDIEVVPHDIAFGEVTAGERIEHLVRVQNTGEATLHISLATPDSPFDVSTTSIEVPPSSAVSFSLGFAPLEAFDYAATLQVGSNDPDEPLVLVRLTGTGLPAPPEPDAGIVADAGLDAGGGASTAGGCGCRISEPRSSGRAGLLLAILGLVLGARWRRRRTLSVRREIN